MASILLSYVIWMLLQLLDIPNVWLLNPPSVMAIFGFLYWLFDNWGWNWSISRMSGLVDIPNISGTWEGSVKSSFHDFKVDTPIKMTVHQKWTNIAFVLDGDQSTSRSLSSSLIANDPSGITFSHHFSNRPRADSDVSMAQTDRTALLTLMPDGTLKGEYFTGRGRNTYGGIETARTAD